MKQDDLAEPAAGTGEVIQVGLLKVLDARQAQTIGVMNDAAGGAQDRSIKLFVKVAAFIASGILLAYLVTQTIGISTPLAFALLVAQAGLLAYGLFEWLRNPRT